MAPRLRSLRSPLAILDTRTGKALAPVVSEQDRKRQIDQTRGTARQRGYDRDWEKLRDAVVIERGCRCALCGTVVVLRKREATALTPVAEVDHIESITDRPDLRLEHSNLRVLCKPCHSGRTAKDQGFGRGYATGFEIDRVGKGGDFLLVYDPTDDPTVRFRRTLYAALTDTTGITTTTATVPRRYSWALNAEELS